MLSEKPVANDIVEAERLIKAYRAGREAGGTATWGVAENFRYLETFKLAREKVEGLGRVLGFRVKVFTLVKAGGKYFGVFSPSSTFLLGESTCTSRKGVCQPLK